MKNMTEVLVKMPMLRTSHRRCHGSRSIAEFHPTIAFVVLPRPRHSKVVGIDGAHVVGPVALLRCSAKAACVFAVM